MVVEAKYLCSVQVDTMSYWDQHPQLHVIAVPIRTILHPRIEVNAITYIHDITKNVCNRTQAKKNSRHPICLTDSENDYILEEIGP